MLFYDHRMIEGPPLRYYNPVQPQFSFFRGAEHSIMSSEEVVQPPSPNSIQSDSDNSVSSVEVSTRQIRGPGEESQKSVDVRCCWKNCGVNFKTLDELAVHVTRFHASSGPDGLFYCGWEGCTRNNRGFNARYKMLVHVRTHTNEKPHKCDQCEKSFSRAENLKIHSRSHSGEKPYVCHVPGCNKAYSNSSDRFKHTRTHQVEKPYKCKVPGCPKRYTDPSSLRKHVKTYKHYVNTNSTANESKPVNDDAETEKSKMLAQDVHQERFAEQSPTRMDYHTMPNAEHRYTCTHSCCVGTLPKTTGLLRFEAYFHCREDDIKSGPWMRYIHPLGMETKSIYTPCDLKSEHMEVDIPLDLSINGTSRRYC